MKKQWFTDRVGKTITRINPMDFSTTDLEVTENNVGYLWLYTEKGFKYEDKVKAKPRIHTAPGES
jgi:hypothetical protein